MGEETTWGSVHVLGRTYGTAGDLELIWTGSGVEFEMNCSELGVVLEAGDSVYMPWISLVLDGYHLAHIPVQEGVNKYMLLRNMDPSVKHTVRIVSAVVNYAVMTSDAMNADFRLISQSGWGVTTGWDNNPASRLPLIYDSVNAKREVKDYDHSSWEPDAVIINLGTNDGGAFDNPAFTDPVTGETFKYNKLEDGSYDPEDLNKIAAGMTGFMKHVREVHPDAHILWVYGMLGSVLMDTIISAVSAFWLESDTNAGYLQLPDTNGEAFGSRGHPGILSHKAASEKIVERLREVLK